MDRNQPPRAGRRVQASGNRQPGYADENGYADVEYLKGQLREEMRQELREQEARMIGEQRRTAREAGARAERAAAGSALRTRIMLILGKLVFSVGFAYLLENYGADKMFHAPGDAFFFCGVMYLFASVFVGAIRVVGNIVIGGAIGIGLLLLFGLGYDAFVTDSAQIVSFAEMSFFQVVPFFIPAVYDVIMLVLLSLRRFRL